MTLNAKHDVGMFLSEYDSVIVRTGPDSEPRAWRVARVERINQTETDPGIHLVTIKSGAGIWAITRTLAFRAGELCERLDNHNDRVHGPVPGPTTHEQKYALARRVMEYAKANYGAGGWDVIVECWTLDQIADSLTYHHHYAGWEVDCRTLDEALKFSTIAACVDVYADQQAEARYQGQV